VKRRDLLIGAVALLGSAGATGAAATNLLNANSAPRTPLATPGGTIDDHAPPEHWSYGGATGPDRWSELDAANSLCNLGGAQSPIDLANPLRVPNLPGLHIDYRSTRVTLTNTGHTIQVNYDAGSSLTVDGRRFALVQFHFHTPSEHTIDGVGFPMELHLVHQAAADLLAVIGVVLVEGRSNAALASFWERMPRNPGAVNSGARINAQELLPPELDDYFTYSGSLTTPPCTESVRWIVLRRPMEISHAQISAFREIFGANARPAVPVGARLVLTSGNG
jgi:carbonic anhydrase